MSISKGEEILLVGLQQLALKLPELKKYMGDYDDEVDDVVKLIDATLNMFEAEGQSTAGLVPGSGGRNMAILHDGFRAIHRHLSAQGLENIHPARMAATIARDFQKLISEHDGYFSKPVQFNPGEYDVKRPLDWHEEGFKDFHPAVRGTSYGEIHELLGTSGCSPEQPYWVWSVCGVIQGTRGRQVVCPNDWILELAEGVFTVVPDSVYRSFNKESNNAVS